MLSRKQKRVGVHGRGQVIRLITADFGVGKRKLRQGKKTILIALGRQSGMHFGKRFLGLVFEALVEIEIHQLARRKGARPFGRENIRGERLIGDALVDVLDADRRGAPRGGKKYRQRTKINR